MSTTLISSNPDFKKKKPDGKDYLNVSEFFSDTLQGENFVGWPATFLRLQSCTLNCHWCFYETTRIRTRDKATKLIKDIKKGEVLLTLDKDDNIVETTVREVLKSKVSVTELMTIETSKKGQPLIVTKSHPIYVKNKGWVRAVDITLGDIILSLDSKRYLNYRMKEENPSYNRESINKGRITKRKNIIEGKTVPYIRTDEIRKLNSDRMKLNNPCFDKEVHKRSSQNRFKKPSRLENEFIKFISDVTLPINYIGNNKRAIGDSEVGFKFPDFEIEGENKIIEIYDTTFMYADNLGGRKLRDENWINSKSEFYSKFGYETLFLNQEDLKLKNRELLKQKVFEFAFNGEEVLKINKELTVKQKARLFNDGQFSGEVEVYNLSCYPYNTYLANNLLVHNCDTTEVWRVGNPYSFDELFDIMGENGVINKLADGQHLILTGGSPLLQQDKLTSFLNLFISRYGFTPYIEIENECVLMPHPKMASFISTWNNSPKLANSGMKRELRYKPDIIKEVAEFNDSWFKFVIDAEEDWEEIQMDFLDAGLIQKNQIVLMPQGQTQEELNLKREWVAEMAIKHNVRFSDRLHVTLWNKKTGV